MTRFQVQKSASREEQTRQAGRGFRLLLCAFLFTAAAVCKNVLPEGYRRALVTGLDTGVSAREVLEVLGSPERVRTAAEQFWNGRVLRVFGIGPAPQPASGGGTEEAQVSETAGSPMLTAAAIPVFSHRAVDIEAGPLPVVTADDAARDAEQTAPQTEEAVPEETGVLLDAYAPEGADAALPVPDAVCREAVRIGIDHISPVRGTLTSGFGYRTHPIDGVTKFHYGVDLAVPLGTEVRCFADGEVVFAGWGDINGNYIRVAHGEGLETLYAHLETIRVRQGDPVRLGDTLGTAGETGEASGPHLHFQLYCGGKLIDPAPLLEFAS